MKVPIFDDPFKYGPTYVNNTTFDFENTTIRKSTFTFSGDRNATNIVMINSSKFFCIDGVLQGISADPTNVAYETARGSAKYDISISLTDDEYSHLDCMLRKVTEIIFPATVFIIISVLIAFRNMKLFTILLLVTVLK